LGVYYDNQSEKKGLYPDVLEDLFNKKLDFKARLAPLEKKKQHLGKIISSAKESGKRIPEREAGNSLSPIFLRELACETIMAGKYNLNLIAEFVIKKGFRIKYGNTNSLYLTCPNRYYKKCDEAFSRKELSKEAYWTEMVKITINVMKKLYNQVNAYLRIKNGTSYLKIVYEEILFPICFTGIDTIKQGKSQLLKFIREKIMREAMNINNTRPIHKIVKDTLREAGNKKWDFNKFIVMGTWRPKKENLCNNHFMKCIRERNERIPDPGKPFSYVIMKASHLHNEKGRLIPYRVGDYMKYLSNIAKK
ncbi:17387_t:CDS:2, partial [Funneliformis geosporum]